MASTYRTARKKIVDALVEKLKGINGNHPYNSNVFNNVHGNMIFLDQIQEYPKVCVVAGDETKRISTKQIQVEILTIRYKMLCRESRRPTRGLSSVNGRH